MFKVCTHYTSTTNYKTMTKLKHFILDVDGVMTDGKFYYSEEGKIIKSFGADDSDALNLLSNFMNIEFISADKRGFNISKKRIEIDMGFKLSLVNSKDRINWIRNNYDLTEVVFMGDGFFDHQVMNEVAYSIAPSDGDELTRSVAKFVTKRGGGDRSVSEACVHILESFFKEFDRKNNS